MSEEKHMYKRDIEKMMGIKGSINFFKWVKTNGTILNSGSKNKYLTAEVVAYMAANDIAGPIKTNVQHTHNIEKIEHKKHSRIRAIINKLKWNKKRGCLETEEV